MINNPGLVKFFQVLTYSVVKPVLLIMGSKFTSINNVGKGQILMANHISYFDFLLVPGCVKFSEFIKNGPFYSMTANKYLEIPIIGMWLQVNGAFHAHPNAQKKEYGIDASVKLLKRGNCLIIFPQGSLPRGRIRKPHNGVRVIANKTGSKIVPLFIGRISKFKFEVVSDKEFDSSEMTTEEIFHESLKLERK